MLGSFKIWYKWDKDKEIHDPLYRKPSANPWCKNPAEDMDYVSLGTYFIPFWVKQLIKLTY